MRLALDVRFVVRQTCVAEGRWVVGGEASYWPAWSKRKLGVMVRRTVTG